MIPIILIIIFIIIIIIAWKVFIQLLKVAMILFLLALGAICLHNGGIAYLGLPILAICIYGIFSQMMWD
jgi:hypothetical protein